MNEIEEKQEFILKFSDYPRAEQNIRGTRIDAMYIADQLADELDTKVDVYRLEGERRIYLETSYPDYYWRRC